MNITRRLGYSVAVALVIAGCGAIEERRAHFERTWPASGIRRLEVDEVMGTIDVEAGAGDRVQMSAEVRSRGQQPDKKKENDGYFTTEVVGDTLIIESQKHRHHGLIGFWNNDAARIDYHLRVPPEVALELKTVNGRIETRGIAGEMTVGTINGEVDIESTGSNEVAAKAINGRIAVRFLNDFHGARLGTVNGRVTAVLPANASFLGDFNQVNGDFEAAFPLNIHSHPGSRRASGEVNGGRYSLKITTVNGDIKIDNSPAPPAAPATPEIPAPPAPPARTAPRT